MIKKIILVALLAGIAVASANAQETPADTTAGVQKPHRMRKSGYGQWADLNLSEQQQAEMKKLNAEFRTQMKELDKEDEITVKESRERKKALMTSHKEKISAILTPEQREKIIKKQENRPKKFRKRGQPVASPE